MDSKVPLSHIAEIIMGQSPKGEEVNNEGIGLPLLNGPTEFTDRYPIPVQHTAYAKKTSLPRDILFCVRGSTTGKMNYSDQKYCIGRGLAAIRGRNGYPTPYVKAVLEAYLPELLVAATGSTFPNVSKDLINNILVEVLSIKSAINISKLIESQEGKIFNNHQISQTLEQMAQSLFKSWFIDFEPVKAKIAVLEAGGSQEESTLAAMTVISGKNVNALMVFEREHPEKYAELKATAELFPSAMQESELGEIPKGWSSQRFSNIATLHYGKALKKTDRTEGPYPVYGSGGITGSHINYLIEGPGIIVGRKGSIGTLYWEDRKFHPIDTVYYVSHKESVPLSYLYYLMKTLNLPSMNTDAAVPGLNRDNVYRLEILKPIQSILNKFNNHVSAIRNMIQKNNVSIATLTALSDTILPKLLSGEITLPEAEQAVSEAENV